MNLTPVVLFVVVLVFVLGVLTGSGMITRDQEARERRQAATQRDLNRQWHALETSREANRLFAEALRQSNADRHQRSTLPDGRNQRDKESSDA